MLNVCVTRGKLDNFGTGMVLAESIRKWVSRVPVSHEMSGPREAIHSVRRLDTRRDKSPGD